MSGRRIDPDVRTALEEVLALGYTPTRALELVVQDPRYAGRTPSLRTVTALKAQVRPRDASHTWSPATADPEEARLVMPVLVDLVRGGQLTSLTRDMARWIARVRVIAPDLDIIDTLRFAGRYLAAESGGEAFTAEVDVELARRLAQKRPPG